MHRIFDKTDKGREEIATRKYRLAPRLRTLLLLIDGKQNTGQLLQKIAGLDEQSIEELLAGEFIQEVSDSAAVDPAEQPNEDSTDAPETIVEQPAPPAIVLAEGESKFQAIRKFYTETIRTTIGLRGYNLQLKVDEAKSVDDLHALQEPYIAAVVKAKGEEATRNLHDRLEQFFKLEEG